MMLKYIFKRHLKKRLVLIILSLGTISTMFWILFEVLSLSTSDKAEPDIFLREEKLDFANIPKIPHTNIARKKFNVHQNLSVGRPQTTIDIWSTVGLGDYTWEHILGGDSMHVTDEPAVLIHGDILFKYHGEDDSLDDVSLDSAYVLLVLNGRAEERLPYTRMWLEKLTSLTHLRAAFLMLIGNEECNNDWLLQYLKNNGGLLQKVFITYDTPIVDNRQILQWPLGSATYRGFPLEDQSMLLSADSRQYRCNFLGTTYPGSSREYLVRIIETSHLKDYCYVKTRQLWEAEETKESMEEYIQILQQSDLTLSPIGKNIECYRIYEAAAMGSVPVIEDVRTSDQCSDRTLRVLKDRNAPFIYVKDWSELPEIIRKEMKLTPEMIIERRKNLIEWYRQFKQDLRQLFFKELEKNL
ncbi:putative transmembrane protein [Apostichopus japonicus]|uniref:Putative transmembrane protein n=1 Tax=Stichopus japonicus TaxID=307972 RepID=A0A2G8KHH8_STIJA|nr:putative transmembrane protein [Apostichopus japonicus]